MKDHLIRRTFVVTHSIPCSACGELKSDKEVFDRHRYFWNTGEIVGRNMCEPCMNTLVDERREQARIAGSEEQF